MKETYLQTLFIVCDTDLFCKKNGLFQLLTTTVSIFYNFLTPRAFNFHKANTVCEFWGPLNPPVCV